MKKYILIVILLVSYCVKGYAQTVTINAEVVFPNPKDTINPIRFVINNQKFGEKDTVIKININARAFDSCQAIFGADTMNFLTKFKKGEIYELRQSCCCAAFTLSPKNSPKRGTVSFKNTTKRDVVLVVAEANFDTVKVQEEQTLFSYESAMCLFKPCSILLTETDYYSDKYDYKNINREYDNLWIERSKLVLTTTWFHFLHGEKIEVDYNEKTTELKIKLIGYISDKEYEKFWK